MEFYELFPDIYNEVAKEILFVKDVKKRYSIIRHCFASQKMQKLKRLESLESLQRLQSLERLEMLQSIETSKLDYRQVLIPYDSVVYADPPYKGKKSYSVKFDSDLFFDWCRNQNFPIYISEYDAPKDFKAVFEINKTNCLCATKNFTNKEKIFLHERWMKSNELYDTPKADIRNPWRDSKPKEQPDVQHEDKDDFQERAVPQVVRPGVSGNHPAGSP